MMVPPEALASPAAVPGKLPFGTNGAQERRPTLPTLPTRTNTLRKRGRASSPASQRGHSPLWKKLQFRPADKGDVPAHRLPRIRTESLRCVVVKKLNPREVFNAMKLANISTGTILIVVGVSTIFGRFLTMYQIPQKLAAEMMLFTTNTRRRVGRRSRETSRTGAGRNPQSARSGADAALKRKEGPSHGQDAFVWSMLPRRLKGRSSALPRQEKASEGWIPGVPEGGGPARRLIPLFQKDTLPRKGLGPRPRQRQHPL